MSLKDYSRAFKVKVKTIRAMKAAKAIVKAFNAKVKVIKTMIKSL